MREGEVWYKEALIDEKWGENKPARIFVFGEIVKREVSAWRRAGELDYYYKVRFAVPGHLWEDTYFSLKHTEAFCNKNRRIGEDELAKLLLTGQLDERMLSWKTQLSKKKQGKRIKHAR